MREIETLKVDLVALSKPPKILTMQENKLEERVQGMSIIKNL
jgi:hypothetical protein